MDFQEIGRHVVVSVLPVLIAITFHELSHGFIAYKLGDSTAKMMGRLTINPFAHIDLIGTIIMPLMLLIFTNGQFVFGYAKPVPINPMNFKNPRRDMAISAAAGPIMNLTLAFLSYIILRFLLTPLSLTLSDNINSFLIVPLILIFKTSVLINVILAVFNMIPIPPLDGGRVLVGFLPYKQALSLSKIEPFGFIIVLFLIATGIANYFIVPIVNLILKILFLF